MIRQLEIGILMLAAAVAGCSRTDTDIRVWRAGDHDQSAEPPSTGPSVDLREKATVSVAAPPQDARTIWTSLCAGCHGQIGQGNGPMGPSVGARNLADPRWQTSTTDEQIAAAILNGKGRMPAFTLKPNAVQLIIQLIRQQATN